MGEFKGVNIDPELSDVLLISIFLISLGLIAAFVVNIYGFNFYSSKIAINGVNVHEELYYKPNQDYHTLYRNFVSQVYWYDSEHLNYKNSILFSDVNCPSGNAYLRDYTGQCYSGGEVLPCYAYTENNEYGCSFGLSQGFSKGGEYTISADYMINSENLFKINNNYYIKFVAYSPKNHIKLTNKNFFVNGNVVKKNKYLPNENVIIYIPYTGDVGGFNIIEQKDFEFDSSSRFILVILAIIPGLLFFFAWFFFGKERAYEDIPKELSSFPMEGEKRKVWEVAAYFNPPFLSIDKNFFSSVLLNFYNNKVIDIKEKGKDVYIKLNKFQGDEMEKRVYDILEFVRLNIRPDKDNKFIDGEYFNFKKFTQSFYYMNNVGRLLMINFMDLSKEVKEKGKEYMDDSIKNFGVILFLFLPLLIVFLLSSSFNFPESIYFVYILAILFGMFSLNGALLSRFKGNYYIEYQKWQAFKKYLKNSFSIKTATHKTLVMWNEYLIYATALGVPKKVIEELKNNSIITEDQSRIYTGISTGTFFSMSGVSASSGVSGGGFGGAGGGGVGGGGGGGR